MEHSEQTDNILFEDITQTDRISSTRIQHPDLGFQNVYKYLLVLLVLITCFLIILWSRLDINETNVAMGNAQKEYRIALEENHRLQLELNLLLDPASIERQVESWDLQPQVQTVDIYEVK